MGTVLRKPTGDSQTDSGFEPLLPCGNGPLCLEAGGFRLVISRPIDMELLRQVIGILKTA